MGASVTHKYEGKEYIIEFPSADCEIYKWCVEHNEWYEQSVLEKLRSMNLKGICLDIGANVGNHAVYLGLFTEMEVIICYEPSFEFSSYCRVNLNRHLNSLRWRLHTEAMGLYSGHGKVRQGTNGLENRWVQRTDDGEILIRRIDEVPWSGEIGLIKVDTEGREADIVLGAREIIARHKPVVCIELIGEENYKRFEVIAELIGYECDGVNYFPQGSPTYIWTAK